MPVSFQGFKSGYSNLQSWELNGIIFLDTFYSSSAQMLKYDGRKSRWNWVVFLGLV